MGLCMCAGLWRVACSEGLFAKPPPDSSVSWHVVVLRLAVDLAALCIEVG